MPTTRARAAARAKGHCVNCDSPDPDRIPTHGSQCETCRDGGQGGRLRGMAS